MTELDTKAENEKRTPSVGIVIFRINDKGEEEVLLVRHNENAKVPTGLYGFGAGKPEKGETKKQAAVREFEEETGLVIAESDLAEFEGNYFERQLILKEGAVEFSFTVFFAKHFSGELSQPENRKDQGKTTPEWVAVNRLQFYELLPNVAEIVQSAIEFKNSQN